MCPMIDPEEYGLDEGQEPTAVDAGQEYKLIITGVQEGTDKNGLDYLMPSLEIVGEPYSKDFTYFLHVPDKENMGAKKLNQARFNYSSFCKTFGIDLSRPFDPKDDWPGHEGWAILGAKNSEEYGEQNFVKKLLAPK